MGKIYGPRPKGHVVKDYYIGHTHIIICDDCYRDKTPEEIKAQENRLNEVCIRLMRNAYLREKEEEERSRLTEAEKAKETT